MAKTFKVNMNIDEPDETLRKAKKGMEKHLDMGVDSPLIGSLDMVDFGARVDQAILMRKNATIQTDLFQERYNDAEVKAGTAKGQTRDSVGTIYHGVIQVRDILLPKNRLTEEALQSWGFNVVISSTGARRNVRVDIPDNVTAQMIELGRAIVDKHLLLGVASPLTGNIDMTAFETTVTEAEGFLAEWETAKDLAQELNNDAIMLIGYGAGQTKDTVGTIYFDRCTMRDRLEQKYQGNEEHLGAFGFDVVISEHSAKHKSNGGGGSGGGVTFPIIWEGDLNMGNAESFNLLTLNAEAHPAITFIFENLSTSLFRICAAASPTDLPGAGAVLDVSPGNAVPKTLAQLISELGASSTKHYLIIYNVGPAPAHFKVIIEE